VRVSSAAEDSRLTASLPIMTFAGLIRQEESRPMPPSIKAVCIAACVAAAGSASAQSVTLYGKVDIGLRKAVGTDNKEVATGGDSRLGFRGSEDLGSGLKAFYQIEHRFFPNNGAIDGSQFWKGISHVGLEGGWGRLALGRQYIAAFSLVQNQIDPFGADTVAGLRDVGLRVGGITKVRIDNSIRYDLGLGGLNIAASIAEALPNGGPDRPVSVAANYRAGPWFVGAGIENPAGSEDEQWNLGVGYNFGTVLLTAGYASGTTVADVKAKGWMVGVNWSVGAGAIKAGYAEQERGGVKFARKLGLGYHHSLSKRTTIYTDLGHDSKAATSKTGYDLGIIHTF
jgi:predicted porin